MRVLQLALCLLALVALASAVPTAIHPLAHRMRLPQQHTKGSSSSSSSSSSLAFQNKKSPEALFQLSPDYVVPYITIDFDPEVKASDALQRVTEVIKSTKQTESHFLVAANFDADEIEKSNAKLAKAADAEAQLLKDLAALVEKKQGAKSVLDDPKVQEALKTKKSEQKVDEVTKKLHTEQKQAVKPEENLAALKTHFLLAGAKPADLKVGAAYIVRVEVKKFPDDKQLDLLKKAIDALTKDFSKVSGVVKAYASTAAVNPFACIAPGNGNTPCDGTQYNDVPDMTPWQATYLDATTGVNWNAMKAKNIPGTDGTNVRFIDIESDFDDQHVNLPAVGKVAAQGLQPAPSYPRDADNMDHGSAVLGMLVATGKIGGVGTKGMKGMVPAAAPHFTTRFIKPAGSFVIDEGSAVERVVDNMNPTYGDVIILEMQRPFSGVGTCGNPVYYNVGPVEGVTAVRDKIKVALANGAVVVAAGGNGAVDLDDATCQTFFKMNPHTIIVGAATSAAVNNKQLEVWSVKGARVDVHALGSDIATLGFRNDPYGRGAYRDDPLNALVAPQPNSPHHDYTHVFGGTSGATPQVAAVAIAMAGIMKHYDLQIPPSTFQSIIRSTATTAIGGAAGGSGGLLNAEAAVDKMLATVRKCRYCQFSLTRTMPLNILMSIMTTDDAAKFTCSKLGGEKAECEKFINWVSLHLYLQSPTNHKDATFGSELADIAMKLVGNVNPSNAEAVRVIDSVCTASVGSPCKLSQAHYGAWVAQHSTHPYLADSATRALSN